MPLLVGWFQPTLQGFKERSALAGLKGCTSKPNPTECYAKGLSVLVKRGDYRGAASLCKRFGDPACYQGYGQLVPNPSLCLFLMEAGGPAVQQCYLGNCRTP